MASLSIVKIIEKKRDKLSLSREEIDYFVDGVASRSIQEVQIGAMLMALYLNGCTAEETAALTEAMRDSGRVFRWPAEWQNLVVDKHSTGGIGDKISLLLAPALAACGLKVPMISGRGLDITGGTLDKLESIPGFRVKWSAEEVQRFVSEVGCCIVGQAEDLVPADGVLYAFRDVTATVPSLPLTSASIISKKAAENPSCLILDVKYGTAAFMKTKDEAKELALMMVGLGNKFGIKTSAVLSTMDAPLGSMAGNALEVLESVQCLRGTHHPPDILELVEELGGELLRLQGRMSREEGKRRMREALSDGSALAKFRQMLLAQGVSEDVACRLCDPANDPRTALPRARHVLQLTVAESGYVHHIDALTIGQVVHSLGAGRTKAGEAIDYAVGIELLVQLGDPVREGEVWMKVHHNKEASSSFKEDIRARAGPAIVVKPEEMERVKRVSEIISFD